MGVAREFIAIIGLEQDDPEITPGELLEMEFGRMRGITLEDWAIVDQDVLWEQYLRYLVDWAISHSGDEEVGASLATYKAWVRSLAVEL